MKRGKEKNYESCHQLPGSPRGRFTQTSAYRVCYWTLERVVISAIYLAQVPHLRGEESQAQRDLSRVPHPGRSRAQAQPKCPLPFRDPRTEVTQRESHNRPCCFGGLWERRDTVAHECQLNEPPRCSEFKGAVLQYWVALSLLGDENSLGHLSKIKIPRPLPKPTESASPRGGIREAEFLDKRPTQLSAAAARREEGVSGRR